MKGRETMGIKERVKNLCKANNISANKLEDILEFGSGYISKLDKSTPNASNIQKIADYFNVTTDYILTGQESTVPQPKNVSEHLQLISLYEKLSEEQKQAILTIMSGMAK